MPKHAPSEFDSEFDETPTRPGQLSSNAHWIFGSVYAALALIGFSFGVWAGAGKTKPVEVVDAKPPEHPGAPVVTPKPPEPNPKEKPPEPQPPEPEPEAKEPEPKVMEPDTKPKEKQPEPKPKPKAKEPEPEPKTPEITAVSFKQVQPILRAYCFDCHGGSTGKPKGGVDVTSLDKMLRSKGEPLIPGKPIDSTLYTTIKAGDMPPDGKKGPNEQELKLIYDWIASGAKPRRRPVRNRRRLGLTRPPGAG